ncbi:MAG: hypothetical protein ABFD81_10950 [Syntrophaceae bacterium]
MRVAKAMHWFSALLMIIVISGCGSVRYVSSLKPTGDKDLRFDKTRFNLTSFTYPALKNNPTAQPQPSPALIYERSKALYPNVFSDEWSALPVQVTISETVNRSGYNIASMITGFSLGIIPFMGKIPYTFNVESAVTDYMGGRLFEKKSQFEIDHVEWGSLLPYGLIPAPGPSDLPRDYYAMDGDYLDKASTKIHNYAADCIVESVVQGLRAAEQAKLASAYQERLAYQQELIVEGKQYGSYLTMNPGAKDRPAEFRALLYKGTPQRMLRPLEDVVVARQDESGAWRPQTGYLRTPRNLTAMSVLMEKGIPAKVVVRSVDEPPLADFIDTPDLTAADRNALLRWSNGVLLDAKNRSLPKILSEESRDGLLSLVTRIEQAILDLSEKAEQAKDRAQRILEKGEGDPDPERELSLLCRQRIEILKPILAAIKQEAALKK